MGSAAFCVVLIISEKATTAIFVIIYPKEGLSARNALEMGHACGASSHMESAMESAWNAQGTRTATVDTRAILYQIVLLPSITGQILASNVLQDMSRTEAMCAKRAKETLTMETA